MARISATTPEPMPRPVGNGPCEWASRLSLWIVSVVFIRVGRVRFQGAQGASLD